MVTSNETWNQIATAPTASKIIDYILMHLQEQYNLYNHLPN